MKYIIATIVLLLASLIGHSQNTDFSKLDSLCMILEEEDRFFGSVAVSRAGEILYSKALGYADLANKVPNTSETKFRIGSTSKTFTATLIMRAVELGKIDLDDTIEEYFPRIQNASKINIRHLLNHRSGINTFTDRSFFSWHLNPITKAALLDTIVSKGIDFEPNAQHVYSNSNYVLLTFILEKIFDKTYAQILEELITEPLGLANTSYGGKINPAQNEARSYRMKDAWTLQSEEDMSIPQGAGGIISTPTDLCRFGEALFEGSLISKESLRQMKPVGEDSYGFGLEGVPMDGMHGWGHPGVIDAFSSTWVYFEEEDLCIALNANGTNYGSHDIAIAVLREVLGKPYELPNFTFQELTSEELDQYVGVYESDDLPMDLTISKEENTLFVGMAGQPADALTAEGDHRFSIMKYGVKITFKPAEHKMHFEQQGMAFDLTLKQAEESVDEISIELDLDLDQYLGTYASDQLPMDLIISKDANTLIAQGTGQASFPLKAEGEHVFSYKDIGLTLTFLPAENKLHFKQGGAAFEMTREK